MVKANVDNDIVSIQLRDGEETTVPSDETWKVTLVFAGSHDYARMRINGVRTWSRMNDRDENHGRKTYHGMVFAGGDTIRADNYNGSTVYLQGFVVNKDD